MRKKRSVLSYGLIAMLAIQLATVGFPLPKVHAAAGDLIINEINWAGSSGRATDEWIELFNPMAAGSPVVDFSVSPHTLELRDTADTLLQTIVIGGPSAPTLAPGEYLLIHNNVSGSTLETAAPGVKYYTPAVPFSSLPNEATQYILRDTLAAEVDAVKPATAGTPAPFAGKAETSTHPVASMERVYVGGVAGPGTSQSSWRSSRTLGVHFTVNTVQYGTPGTENVIVTAPVNTQVSPVGNITEPTSPTIAGTVATGIDSVTVFTDREGPVPTTATYNQAVSGTSFSITPALAAGRYTFQVSATDAMGNESERVDVLTYPGTEQHNYVVFAGASSVSTPVLGMVPVITNQATVTVSATTDASVVEMDVLRDGVYLQTVPVTSGVFSATLFLVPNTMNDLTFVAVEGSGAVSMPVTVQVTHDNIAPVAVDASRVDMRSNQPGTADTIEGMAGAAEAGTLLSMYSDALLMHQIGTTVTVPANGSFPLVNLGDNKYGQIYIRLVDLASNASVTTVITNKIAFENPSNGIGVYAVSVSQTQAKLAWNPVDGAVNYRIKYRTANGTYSAAMSVCNSGVSSCPSEVTLINLQAGTAYVLAVAAVDAYGNEAPYTEFAFQTQQPVPAMTTVIPASATPDTEATPAVTRRVQSDPTPDTVVDPAPTTTPTPENEEGEVKSTTEEVSQNWTPWIVLATLLGIAALATLGYFYWFGGAAGEAALASAQSAKERAEANAKKNGTEKSAPKEGKDKRW